MERTPIIRPGFFSVNAAADSRRYEFDAKNEVVVHNGVQVDAVFLGDSITHAWELNAYFGGRNRIVLNRGIGGDKSGFLARRFMADCIQLKPRMAVVLIGINDTWIMDDIGAPGNKVDEVAAVVMGNWTELIEQAKQHGQTLLLCSLLPTDISKNATNRERNEMIARLNRELERQAQESGSVYVDYHSAMVGEDGVTLREGLAHDGLHPHVQGYNLMAEVLRSTAAGHGITI
ncbi:GDSL-type esterase/lipase family protein [Paenibacillus sp. GCM10023252]|uniref:GDSL-type esterase/lipase family protein n=1 Tax=Paenibacillus sp. GCM10023252 TaxID=3252649 RepID=UPI0036119C20